MTNLKILSNFNDNQMVYQNSQNKYFNMLWMHQKVSNEGNCLFAIIQLQQSHKKTVSI